MPFTLQNIPKQAKVLPKSAQKIWVKAFNSADERGLSEERAIKSAWGAVKNAGFRKGRDGVWRKVNIKKSKEADDNIMPKDINEAIKLSELHTKLRKALQERFTNNTWIVDVTLGENKETSFVIFEMNMGPENGFEFFQVEFEIDGDSNVTLAEEKQKVEKKIDFVPMTEAMEFIEAEEGPEKNRFKVAIIKAGKSLNNNHYPKEVLRQSVPLFEGAKVFSRSDESHCRDIDVDVNKIAGWIESVGMKGNNVEGILHIIPEEKKILSLIQEAITHNKMDLLGLSIVASGAARIKRQGESLIRMVESIDKVHSVDLVVNPAAGGRILKLVASVENNNSNQYSLTEDLGQMEKLLQLLKEKSPDLYETIDLDNITEEKVHELLAEAMTPPEPKKEEPPKKEDEPKTEKKTEAVVTPPSETTTQTDLTEAMAAQKVELEKMTEALKKTQCRTLLKETLDNAKLIGPARILLEKQFNDKIFEAEELQVEIKSIKDMLAAFSPTGDVTGLGQTAEMVKSETDKHLKAMEGFFMQGAPGWEPDPKFPAFKSFKEAYITMTGDKELHGHFESSNIQRYAEALQVSSWGQILGDSITRRMIAEYNGQNLQDWRKIVSSVVPVSDFRTNRRMRMGGYANLPAVAETGNYNPLTSPGDEEATYAATKRGGTETITMEMVANDDVGSIRRIPIKLGRAAANTLYQFVFDFIRTNPNTTYDGTAIFTGGHGNLTAAVLSAAALLAARIAMADIVKFGQTDDFLNNFPKWLLVPNELMDTAFRLTSSAIAVQTSNFNATEPNINAGTNNVNPVALQPILIPYWTDATDWALVGDGTNPTIEIGFFQGREEPELFIQDMANIGSMFNADSITYKIRHIYGGAVLDHRGMHKSINP